MNQRNILEKKFDLATGYSEEKMRSFLQDKVVMVTGGAGSVGSQLCKLLYQAHPKRLIIVDQNEAALWALGRSLGEASDPFVSYHLSLDKKGKDYFIPLP